MRIVYIVRRFPKLSETFVLNEVREVLRQGDEVTVVSLAEPHADEPRHPGAEAVLPRTVYGPRGEARVRRLALAGARALLRRPRRAWPALAWAARAALRERTTGHLKQFGEAAWLLSRLPADVDHVHAHFAHAPATAALLLARLLGRPFSFTAHANDIYTLTTPQLLRAKIAEARFVATVSDATHADVAQAAPADDRAKVVVVRNGIDRRRFAPRAEEPRGAPVVLCVSRLVEKKGVDTLIEACARLAARGVDLRLEVMGDGPLRGALEERARALGVAGRVALLGNVDQAAVLAGYRRASVLALACRHAESGDRDGLPVALVEAMAAGLPVVSTPISGIPEVVRDGESGLLVAPDDADALAGAIGRVLADADFRARLARGARAATDAYDERATVAGLRRLFRGGPAAEAAPLRLPLPRGGRVPAEVTA
jgi:glycosyltransferase involved in cell wall biosynthesis